MTDAHAGNADSARVAGLDLLRGLAALSVALPHFLAYRGVFPDSAETISALAVEVFFVLSGHVLAPQILFCLDAGRPRYLGVFLMRRWMRTIPPYLFALVLISLVSGQLLTADFFRYAFYVQNLVSQHNAEDYFPVAWSLSIEEWFYVTMPIWLLVATSWLARWDTRRVVVFVLAGLLSITALWGAFLPAGLYLLIHLVEGETVTPMLLARRFTINPVLVILSLVFWYWMWGVPGAILSTPMLAITKIICDRIRPLMAFGHFMEG